MHFPTTALFAISFYIIGRSSAKRARPEPEIPYDGFGLTNYGFICDHRAYSKPIVYATANHSCVTNAAHPELKKRKFEKAGFRTEYSIGTFGDDQELLNPDRVIVPINGEDIFPFEIDHKSRQTTNWRGEMITIQPGKDRLVLGDDCNLLGILIDVDHPNEVKSPRVRWCTAVKEYSDYFLSADRPYESPNTYPENPRRRSRAPYQKRHP